MKESVNIEWDTESGRIDYHLNGALADLIYMARKLEFDLLSGNLRPNVGVGRPPADVSPKAASGNQPVKFSARTVA